MEYRILNNKVLDPDNKVTDYLIDECDRLNENSMSRVVCDSSSEGNFAVFRFGLKWYIVDVGVTAKRVKDVLDKLGNPKISGVFITHLHEDHYYKSGVNYLKKLGVPFFVNGSWDVKPNLNIKFKCGLNDHYSGASVLENTGSYGFVFEYKNYKHCWLTDLGNFNNIPVDVEFDFIDVEVNYDRETGSRCMMERIRPEKVLTRGFKSHASLEQTDKFLRERGLHSYHDDVSWLHMSQSTLSKEIEWNVKGTIWKQL